VSSTSRIEVDLTAVSHNVRAIRGALAGDRPGSQPGICAVIKADGYGLGAVRLAKRLEIEGVEMLAVSSPDLVRDLANGAIRTNILALLPFTELSRSGVLYRVAAQGLLHQAVHDIETYQFVARAADHLGIILPIHIEVDTGMSRGGCSPEIAQEILRMASQHKRLRISGVFTHFASADCDAEFTARQDVRFESFLEQAGSLIPQDAVIHEANTFGFFRKASYHRSMVRVGLALLGYAGEEFGEGQQFELGHLATQLKPVVRWESSIVQKKTIPAGAYVGYGSTWQATRETTLGIVPVGYADGYPLPLTNRGRVGVHLEGGILAYVSVVGRVSMDQITIDLTEIGRAHV